MNYNSCRWVYGSINYGKAILNHSRKFTMNSFLVSKGVGSRGGWGSKWEGAKWNSENTISEAV